MTPEDIRCACADGTFVHRLGREVNIQVDASAREFIVRIQFPSWLAQNAPEDKRAEIQSAMSFIKASVTEEAKKAIEECTVTFAMQKMKLDT